MLSSQLFVDNRLSLQHGNTECILLLTKKKLSLHIECNDHIINSIDKVKYLGIFF